MKYTRNGFLLRTLLHMCAMQFILRFNTFQDSNDSSHSTQTICDLLFVIRRGFELVTRAHRSAQGCYGTVEALVSLDPCWAGRTFSRCPAEVASVSRHGFSKNGHQDGYLNSKQMHRLRWDGPFKLTIVHTRFCYECSPDMLTVNNNRYPHGRIYERVGQDPS